jgi:hypothetical protein
MLIKAAYTCKKGENNAEKLAADIFSWHDLFNRNQICKYQVLPCNLNISGKNKGKVMISY